jgi:hypothetical protein
MPKADEFIVGSELNGYRAFFEQDDETGYLYLADPEKILLDLHIYNRKPSLLIREHEVEVIWAKAGERCGVLIRGKLCGVIGLNGDLCRPAHVLDSEGITDPKWTIGFDLPK